MIDPHKRSEQPLIAELVAFLGLQPHPEGGWYRESYRAAETVASDALPERYTGPRSHATAIYFLLDSANFSALHRLKSDEQWHFYSGSPLTIHVIYADGRYTPIKLGPSLAQGETFQAVVPHGCWFGASVDIPDSHALVGCSVAPGFDFADFEIATRVSLCDKFPQHTDLITRLTRL
jgi:predicted cupin superfamily sugar epimerase